MRERMQPVLNRESTAEHEDSDRREESPETRLGSEAERVLSRGGEERALLTDQEHALIERVDETVNRLGEHGSRPGEEPGTALCHCDERIGPDRENDGRSGIGMCHARQQTLRAAACQPASLTA